MKPPFTNKSVVLVFENGRRLARSVRDAVTRVAEDTGILLERLGRSRWATPEALWTLLTLLVTIFVAANAPAVGVERAPGLGGGVKTAGPGHALKVASGVQPGKPFRLQAHVRNLADTPAKDVDVAIALPAGVLVVAGSCRIKKPGRSESFDCGPGEHRVIAEIGRLKGNLGAFIELKCRLADRVDRRERVIHADITSEESETLREAFVFPDSTQGEAGVRNFYRLELEGPLYLSEFEPATESKGFLAESWHHLTVLGLHRFESIEATTLAQPSQLFDRRYLEGRVLEIRTTVVGEPIDLHPGRARNRPQGTLREWVRLGGAGPQQAWCSTTRRSGHLLHSGDQIMVKGVLTGWGLARPNRLGTLVPVTTLACPTIRHLPEG